MLHRYRNSSLFIAFAFAIVSAPLLASEDYCKEASYAATYDPSSKETTLTATAVLPTAGYSVRLAQRPEKIVPPMYDLLCTPPSEIAAEVISTEQAKTKVPGAEPGNLITVFDATSNRTVYVSKICDGFAGVECDYQHEFCYHDPGVCVSSADAQGVCIPKPEICTEEYAPVIGCDGNVYSNACKAAAAGQSVAKKLFDSPNLGGTQWQWERSKSKNQ